MVNYLCSQIFKQNMLWSFERVLLDALLKGNHELLQDDIAQGLYGMAETDFGDFFLSFLPAFVGAVPNLSNSQKEAAVRAFAQQTVSFTYFS